MDLWRRRLRLHANLVFNEYIAHTADLDGLSLLPLFLSCRAGVRAKTSATAASVQSNERQRQEMETAAREHLTLAEQLLHPPAPRLIAIGGLSGSGKSTLARRLAPTIGAAPGAFIVRSDVIRKAMLRVPSTTRLGPEGYTQDVNERVYAAMAEQARAALRAGHSVIADAVHARADDRAAVAAVARKVGVQFTGLWLDGPRDILAKRLGGRVGDASDATADVLDLQLRADLGPVDWHRLDGTGDADSVRQSAEELVGA
jgi:predicted kinase